jgi:transcriptional regulator with XRE-family HTH domain
MSSSNIPKPKTLNYKLRRIRENFRLTYAEMAEELKGYGLHYMPLTAEMIAEIESEQRKPSMRLVRAYAKFHGMRVDSFDRR